MVQGGLITFRQEVQVVSVMRYRFVKQFVCSFFLAIFVLACPVVNVAAAMDEKAMLSLSLDKSYFRHCDQCIDAGGMRRSEIAYSDTIIAKEMQGVFSGRDLLFLQGESEKIFSGDGRHAAIEQAISLFRKNGEGFRYTMGRSISTGSWHFCAVGEKGTVVSLPRY